MSTVGVRELRQNASEILREVEAGEAATVTVAGRPVAQIVPIRGPVVDDVGAHSVRLRDPH